MTRRGSRHSLASRRSCAFALGCTALIVVSAACGYSGQPGGVTPASPGRCVPVDVAATAATAPLLQDAAARFNSSAHARLPAGTCAFVRVESVEAAVALRELTSNWPDAARLGPAPVAWVPASTMWSELLDARLAERHLRAMAPDGAPFARSPLVVAMPALMARALDYPQRPVSWESLAQLARDPRGWGRYGHPEWGRFRLGKGNPAFSTTALDQTVALDTASEPPSDESALERSVVYYADSTQIYLDTWRRLAAKSTGRALTYLSAAITDERSVVAYNSGHLQSDVALTRRGPAKTVLPLVAVYPQNPTIESDNPITVLDAPWTSPAARAGARAFALFALGVPTQAAVAAAGYRPGRGGLRTDVVSRANGAEPGTQPVAVAPATPLVIEGALAHWRSYKKPAHVLVLFDVSESMADAIGPDGPPKLTIAKPALTSAFDQLGPHDNIGLRIFTTKLDVRAHPDWLDVVPIGPFATRQPELTGAVAALRPLRGSPLYAATRDAYDAIARTAGTGHIDGVVVVTDGYDEDDHGPSLNALVAHFAAGPDIHLVTVAYGIQANFADLHKFSEATNSASYDARDPLTITDLLPAALANF